MSLCYLPDTLLLPYSGYLIRVTLFGVGVSFVSLVFFLVFFASFAPPLIRVIRVIRVIRPKTFVAAIKNQPKISTLITGVTSDSSNDTERGETGQAVTSAGFYGRRGVGARRRRRRRR